MLRPLTEEELAELNKPKPLSKKDMKKTVSAKKKQIKKERRKNHRKNVKKVENLKQINQDAAGLDIGANEIYACIPENRDEEAVKVFRTFTSDIHELADWLNVCRIKTIAMESTGVYWIPAYEILESRGFDVHLINARQIKNVPGKKTDVLDCQWIQQLHSYGLLQSSFRPDDEMCGLRALVRHRSMLVKYRAIHIQHIQKNLEMMNVKLCSVVKDITGVTGMKIIRAILDGERDRLKLARFRDPRCFSSEEDIAKALEGNYRSEHIFGLRQAVQLYDDYTHHIQDCDHEIKKKYSASKCYKGGKDLPPLPKKRVKSLKNKPNFDLRTFLYQMCGVDLTTIDGIDVLTAQTVLTEIGLNMDKWPTVKHFTSWLGLCPCNKISGGKILARGSKKNTNRAALALRVAARGLHHSKSALGAFYRRMRAKHGPMKANLATAHKLARIIYFMIKNKEEYQDVGEEYYQKKYRGRIIKNLKRQAASLGLELVPKPV